MIGEVVIWMGYDNRPRPAIVVQEPTPDASHVLLLVLPLDPFDNVTAGQPAAALDGQAMAGGVTVHQWAARSTSGIPGPGTWVPR